MVTPNIHTSEEWEKEPTRRLSGAHLEKPKNEVWGYFFCLITPDGLDSQLPSPCKRDPSVSRHHVVIHLLAQSSHEAKISDLDHLSGSKKDVSGSQVPVDQPPGLQVIHTRRYLSREEPKADQRVLELAGAQGVVQRTQRGQFRYLKKHKYSQTFQLKQVDAENQVLPSSGAA